MPDKQRPSVKNSKKMPARFRKEQQQEQPVETPAATQVTGTRDALEQGGALAEGLQPSTVESAKEGDSGFSQSPSDITTALPETANADFAPTQGSTQASAASERSPEFNQSSVNEVRPPVSPISSTGAAKRYGHDYNRHRSFARQRRNEEPAKSKGDARAMVPATTYKRRTSIPRIIGRVLGVAAAVVLMGAVLLVGALSMNEYHPKASEYVPVSHEGINVLHEGQQISLVTWNLGYCGLSSEADFFMDGGSGVRSVSEEGVKSNLSSIESQLSNLDPDIMLLQEVDKDSRRSYHIDEGADIAQAFQRAGYCSAFATNYLCMFVPYPLPPIGEVYSGIQTESRFAIDSAERVQLPIPFKWPVRMCNLKRCLLVERIPLEDSDHELVVVNLHLEAYDDGQGKAEQTAQLVDLLQREYEKGNYVIAGGDFNQTFSNIDSSAYPKQGDGLWQCGQIDAESFQDGWQLVMDPSTPTCRSLDRPYDAQDANFQYYMIDGFICSANVQVDETTTVDTGFSYTDHNPVKLTVTLASDSTEGESTL